ncbi:2Fe-2S ferredoxin-type domain-containing protein [Paraphysoderma sedebokerense]|nr:2Fe-2S ferredoxin-type domain-containing protein [Paraphysoderma sedebokerense]
MSFVLRQSRRLLSPFSSIRHPNKSHSVNFIRSFSSSLLQFHGNSDKSGPLKYTINFVTAEGDKLSVKAREGDSILDVAHANDIELEGACEGSVACSTCHVIVDDDYFDKIPEASDEENDMLDLAFGLTDTYVYDNLRFAIFIHLMVWVHSRSTLFQRSRLGCQILMNEELDGITVSIPRATRNMAVDGYKPKPH